MKEERPDESAPKQHATDPGHLNCNFLSEKEKTEIVRNGYPFKERLNAEMLKGILSYHFKPKTDKYPNQVLIFWLSRSSCQRWKAKAYKYPKITERLMDREERIQHHIAYRECCTYYSSWKALINDEKDIGVGDNSFFEALEKGRRLFPIEETRAGSLDEFLPAGKSDHSYNQLELF